MNRCSWVPAVSLGFGLLLAGTAGGQQPSSQGGAWRAAEPPAAEARSGVVGRVLLEAAPVSGARVFAYPSTAAAPIGPGFIGAGVTDGEGRFQIGLPPGSYKIGVRRRVGGEGPGLLRPGDYRADAMPEIVEVAEGDWRDLGDLPLRLIDPAKLAAVAARGFGDRQSTIVEGRVVGADGTPRGGYFIHAYRSPEMTGKPDAVAQARADGTYTLHLAEGGAYFMRARPTAGGAVQPGEPTGVPVGVPASRLETRAGEAMSGVDFLVSAPP